MITYRTRRAHCATSARRWAWGWNRSRPWSLRSRLLHATRRDPARASWPRRGFDAHSPVLRRLLVLVNTLRGFSASPLTARRRLRIAASRLDELVPIENANMPQRTVIQWERTTSSGHWACSGGRAGAGYAVGDPAGESIW